MPYIPVLASDTLLSVSVSYIKIGLEFDAITDGIMARSRFLLYWYLQLPRHII